MKYIFYIAKRFFLSSHSDFQHGEITKRITEIVTMDSILCKERYFDLLTNEYIGKKESYSKIVKFLYANDEQILKCSDVNSESLIEQDNEFEFCGYDILDKFDENSWITNMGIDYDNEHYVYTKYGLLNSIESAFKWISDNKNMYQELRLGEYKIHAVWRKIH